LSLNAKIPRRGLLRVAEDDSGRWFPNIGPLRLTNEECFAQARLYRSVNPRSALADQLGADAAGTAILLIICSAYPRDRIATAADTQMTTACRSLAWCAALTGGAHPSRG
jgi:hypothetical protein